MAKYAITHSCGHTQTHALFGPGRDRERKLEWLAGTLCSDCWQAEKDRQHAAETAAAQAQAQIAGLPALTGTPKQVGWAEALRAQALNSLDEFAETIRSYQLPADIHQGIERARRELIFRDVVCKGRRLAIPGVFGYDSAEGTIESLLWALHDQPQLLEEVRDLTELALSELRSESSAKWWIDHRDDRKNPLAEKLVERIELACPGVRAFLASCKEEAANG